MGSEEEATRAASCASASLQRVKESRWQQQTEAKGRSVRPRRRETTSRQTRGQNKSTRSKEKKNSADLATCGDKRQWCLGSEEPFVASHAWKNDVKASVDNTWQISPFCHMPFVGAVVLDKTNGYQEESFCVSSENQKAES